MPESQGSNWEDRLHGLPSPIQLPTITLSHSDLQHQHPFPPSTDTRVDSHDNIMNSSGASINTTPGTPVVARAHILDAGNLSSQRSRLLSELGPIREYDLDTILLQCLPKVPDNFVDPTREELISKGIISGDGQWCLFPVEPSKMQEAEQLCFNKLVELCEEITKLPCFETNGKKLSATRLSDFISEPDKSPMSDREYYNRPDFFFHLRRRRVEGMAAHIMSWLNIICAGEVKKKFNKPNAIDNMSKIIWSCTNILRYDSSRRVTYGLTIEDNLLRIWIFSRAAIMVSEPLLWLKDYSRFIRIVIALSFANSVQCGYSPSIMPFLNPKNEIRYKFIIKGKTYISTGKVFSDFRARRLLGRATRVIEVYLEGFPEKLFALKIYWQPEIDPLEGEQLKRLRNVAKSLGLQGFDNHLMTTEDYGILDAGSVEDRTSNFLPSKQIPKQYYWASNPRMLDAVKEADNTKYGVGDVPPQITGDPAVDSVDEHRLMPTTSKATAIRHRKHVFILFKDRGVALHDIKNTEKFYHYLSIGVRSMQFLHSLGFAHRDISTGNFLVCGELVKLLDLEYIKELVPAKLPSDSGEEMRTGTSEFIAREVQSMSYRHLPTKLVVTPQSSGPSSSSPPPSSPPHKKQKRSMFDKANEIVKKAATEKQVPDPIFTYNALHDSESIYWIILWYLFTHIPVNLGTHDILEQRARALAIFPQERVVLAAVRYDAVENERYIKNIFQCLHRLFKPAEEAVTTIAIGLKMNAEAMQKQNPVPATIDSEEYDSLVNYINQIVQSLGSIDTEFTLDYMRRREVDEARKAIRANYPKLLQTHYRSEYEKFQISLATLAKVTGELNQANDLVRHARSTEERDLALQKVRVQTKQHDLATKAHQIQLYKTQLAAQGIVRSMIRGFPQSTVDSLTKEVIDLLSGIVGVEFMKEAIRPSPAAQRVGGAPGPGNAIAQTIIPVAAQVAGNATSSTTQGSGRVLQASVPGLKVTTVHGSGRGAVQGSNTMTAQGSGHSSAVQGSGTAHEAGGSKAQGSGRSGAAAASSATATGSAKSGSKS